MEVIAMLVYLEAAGLSLNDHRYRQVSDSHTYAASNRAPRRRQASIFSRAIAAVKAYAERRRLANGLYRLNDRLLADAGFTREDIPAVVNGTYVRQHESAPLERPSIRTVHVTGGTTGTVANDNKIQVAA
jgi:uncharacterized protein YjiS (DUF1127 family)